GRRIRGQCFGRRPDRHGCGCRQRRGPRPQAKPGYRDPATARADTPPPGKQNGLRRRRAKYRSVVYELEVWNTITTNNAIAATTITAPAIGAASNEDPFKSTMAT